MTVAQFWTNAASELIIRDERGGKGRGRGRGGGWSGRRGGGWGKGGKKGGGELAADILTLTPLNAATAEIDLDYTQRNRHRVIGTGLTTKTPGSAEIVLEFRRQSDGVWETGATAYRTFQMDFANDNVTQGANHQLVPSGSNLPIHCLFQVYNAGLAAPTELRGVKWRDTGAVQLITVLMENADVHDKFRFRIVGGSVFDLGTITAMREE